MRRWFSAPRSRARIRSRRTSSLSVEYREKTYAAGRIPGFFKREGRPTEKEILSSRLIDRPLRPLFPDGYRNEIQIMCTVLSSDQQNDSDILGVTGASAALMVSDIRFPSRSRPSGSGWWTATSS